MSKGSAFDGYEWLDTVAGGWQFGEAGVMSALIDLLGVTRACECGGGDPDIHGLTLEAHKAILTVVDADARCAAGWRERGYSVIEQRLEPTDVIEGFGAIVLDIDSYEWSIWHNLVNHHEAAVVCVEHHDTHDRANAERDTPPDLHLCGLRLEGGFAFQASHRVLCRIAGTKYVPVWMSRVNTIFVRSDLANCVKTRCVQSSANLQGKGCCHNGGHG